MSGEQSSLCLCVSLELLMTRQAVTAANRKPQENSTWLIKQNASFWYFWSPQTGRVSQSWAVLRTADSTKLAQQKAHSGSGVDNLLSAFQITLTLMLFLHPEGPGVIPDCQHDSQVISSLVTGGIRQWNAGFSTGAADIKVWEVMAGERAKAWNCACSTTEKKGRGPLEICMWN